VPAWLQAFDWTARFDKFALEMYEGSAETRPRKLILEVMAALLFAGIYFYFVKDYAVGTSDNSTNPIIFTSASVSNFHLNHIYDVWKGRFLGLLLSGFSFDELVHHSSGGLGQINFVFGAYQAGWLLLLFLVVILTTPRALLINLGIFLGVMYDLIPASGLYFYPWDIPATVFFTLAVIFFERGRTGLMLLMIIVGCFFKETVLVCAALAFFVAEWKWWKRILVFGLVVLTYIAGKKLVLAALHAPAAAFSMSDAKKTSDLFTLAGFQTNIATLASENGIYVLFANATTLVAVLIFGWQRRFWPYMCLILLFLAGQALYGSFMEYRIFMQVLPLSAFILWRRWFQPVPADQPGTKSKPGAVLFPDHDSWPASKLIVPIILSVIVITTSLAIWQAMALRNKIQILTADTLRQTYDTAIIEQTIVAHWYRSGLKKVWLKNNQTANNRDEGQNKAALEWFCAGSISTEQTLGNLYKLSGQTDEAVAHYRLYLRMRNDYGTNSLALENDLAWFLSSNPDERFRDGKDAVQIARDTCERTEYQIPTFCGTLANAYAEDGQFGNAVETCQKTIALAARLNQPQIVDHSQMLLKLYESGKAFHEAPEAGFPF
jgi:hypothetical protein